MSDLSKFTKALPDYKVSLSIDHNEHKSHYDTVADFLEHMGGPDVDDWLNQEDLDAAIENDNVWVIQWYPNTPVGFCRVYGSTLENALLAARQMGKADE